MRYFIDTEFNAEIPQIELISIGITSEDGRDYYAISSEYDPEKCSDWVKRHVFPLLGNDEPKPLKQIANEIYEFVDGKGADKWARAEIQKQQHEFWGYYADWDWFLLGQNVMGGMMRLPERWPMLCLDVKQFSMHLGGVFFPPLSTLTAHNALADAIWTKEYYQHLKTKEKSDVICGLCGDSL